jgi:AAA domain
VTRPIEILYADFGCHKTSTILALKRGAKVCYAAGEGSYGVGKQRIPAHCRSRGIKTKDLRGKLRIVPAVPLLADGRQVREFIEAQRDLSPDIIVIDTLATATAGEDENGSKISGLITDNGAAGRIKRAFNALVIILAHQGKTEGKGVRGHSGFMGNVDGVLHIEADKTVGAIEVKVEKMKDSRDGFSIYFQAPPEGSPDVPVPRLISEAEYRELLKGSTKKKRVEDRTSDARYDRLYGALKARGAFGFENGLTERDFAELLTLPSRSPASIGKELQTLKNNHRASSYGGLCAMQTPAAGNKAQWRWFLPDPAVQDRGPGSDPV